MNKEKNSKLLRVNDCTKVCPSYEELSRSQCPVQMLDGNVICPVPGLSIIYNTEKLGPSPACLITINFIKNGALLTFSNQHNVMDGTGIFQVVAVLASVLNGEETSRDATEQGNRNPSALPQSIRYYVQATALAPGKWAQIRFLRKTIASLKQLATERDGYDQTVPFISAGDAVSALYWKCLAKARVAAGRDPRATSKFSRTTDPRGVLGVPNLYMGQMELVDLPLSAVASKLRKNLNDVNNEKSVRSYATYIASVPDKTTLAHTGPFNRALDILSSSMAQAALVLKFGALGYRVG
ncbi:hypothetical protein E4T50_15331 [Aureobasidium sp. EXF-12298]|nr:hypothetical protein E4T50_15331 [Aureobasidium sp. EXF-12298]KAI4769285.1 hypothetical protein E4T52_15659 [Aureobasidium sp. EXF-3400]